MFKEQLGTKIRKIRLKQNLSQEELCQITGLSRKFLGQIELGKANASMEKLLVISEALNVSLTTLFIGIGPVQDPFSRIIKLLSGSSEQQIEMLLENIKTPVQRFALIGLRGCGKSTVGAEVSKELGIEFIQIDQELRSILNMNLSDIFYYYGAEQYREFCRKVLHEILERPKTLLLEAGGSLLMDPACFSLLKEKTTLIWLTAAPEDHIKRVHDQGDSRLSSEKERYTKNIEDILSRRTTFYEQADHIIDTSKLGLEPTIELLKKIIQDALPQKQLLPITP